MTPQLHCSLSLLQTHDLSWSLTFEGIFELTRRKALNLAYVVQSPLGFATRDKAAALALATSKAVTDLRQYINSDLGFSDLEICFLCTK